VHLDRGYDSSLSRTLLDGLGFTRAIARKGLPAPVQVGRRWVVERTQSWMNGYGKLRRCTERTRRVVDFYLFLAAAFVVTRCLIQRACARFRWSGRPNYAAAPMMPIPGRSKSRRGHAAYWGPPESLPPL
jgi:hypothetical protein